MSLVPVVQWTNYERTRMGDEIRTGSSTRILVLMTMIISSVNTAGLLYCCDDGDCSSVMGCTGNLPDRGNASSYPL